MTEDAMIEWLLRSEPWVRYQTLVGLEGKSLGSSEVREAKSQICDHPMIKSLVKDVSVDPWPPLTSHKSAGHQLHKLSFLAELGSRPEELSLVLVTDRLLASIDDDGILQVPMKVHPSRGGTGKPELAWALCDAPIAALALVRFGFGDDSRVKGCIDRLLGFSKDIGWPCVVSPKLGGFRGPGRKDDPCPYANLIMLKLLAELPGGQKSSQARTGGETALQLWEQSRGRHPYMFYMGTDFRKLKGPFVWYDILHVADVLSRFPWLREDPRLLDMLAVIDSKKDHDGRYVPESIWADWKGWDFGQKKVASPWMTLQVMRIKKRMEGKLFH